MKNITVVYADFSEVNLDSGDYITELTWVVEDDNYQSLVPHHYFVNYPGAKESEKAIASVVGGAPLVRYSAPIVLRAFFDSLPEKSIIAFRDLKTKEKFKTHLNSSAISGTLGPNAQKSLCVFDDVVTDNAEAAFVTDVIAETRQEAAKKFGNSI